MLDEKSIKYKELISVIVPCYNAEKDIDKLLSSLKKQTYKNLQIILVNDRSSDKTYQILLEKIRKDSRFVILNSREPHGVSCARNAGIDYAQGEFITFIDSDDILSPYHIENLFVGIKQTGADISICAYNKLSHKAVYEKINFNKRQAKYITYNKTSALEYLLAQSHFEYSVWNKMYSAKIFKEKGVRFMEGCRYNEDTLFNYRCFKECEKVVFTNYKTYYYVKSRGSLVRTKFREYKLDAYKSLNAIINDAYENNKEIVDYAHIVRLTMACELLWSLKNSKYKNPPVIQKMIEFTKRDIKHLKRCKKVAVYRRILMPLVPVVAKMFLCKRIKDDKSKIYCVPEFMLNDEKTSKNNKTVT